MTTPYYADATVTIHHGDCLDVLRDLPDASVDAVVTDPPYLLGFMGREWDTKAAHEHLDWHRAWCDHAYRVLKPGGHMLAFGGTRTSHRLACAVEDAGFEIRDSIAWLYGSGFPKSLDVSKAIDKAVGAEREVVGQHTSPAGNKPGGASLNMSLVGMPETADLTAPATDAARTWQGWGTALKPAHEPIVVARKPLAGTVAANVLAHGTGGLNISATRIGAKEWDDDGSRCASCAAPVDSSARPATPATEASTATKPVEPTTSARGEASPAATSKAATGCSDGTRVASTSTSSSTEPSGNNTTALSLTATSSTTRTKTSSTIGSRTCASCAAVITTPTTISGSSAGRWPSNVVLDESQAAALDAQSGELPGGGKTIGVVGKSESWFAEHGHVNVDYPDTGGASRFFYTAKAASSERVKLDGTAHPTVKPLALMRWLVRLVTPPGGTVLEPFAGSGTTVEACILEGFACIAIEREADYLPLIRQRIHRRRDPVEAVRGSGEDAGLFDLLDGGVA